MAFKYEATVQHGEDKTEYVNLGKEGISVAEFEGKKILKVAPEALTKIAQAAFEEVSFRLRPAHTQKVAKILQDPEASDNDKFVALTLLKNACVAAKGILPFCQDTGTAICICHKGQQVWTGTDDAKAISEGIYNAYTGKNLRYSQIAPLTMYEEKNTACNLPAQIDIHAEEGADLKFLFVAKGGGSANKTYYWPMTKALLNPKSLEKFISDKVKTLGTAACPPYHLAIVIGGTSAEMNTHTVKLASCGYLDDLPTTGSEGGRMFRDVEMEEKVLHICQKTGIGAQFGGKYFVHDVRVIRCPRHAASCPVSIGVSCSADRNIKAKIDENGLWLEKMEHNPEQYLPKGDAVNMAHQVPGQDPPEPQGHDDCGPRYGARQDCRNLRQAGKGRSSYRYRKDRSRSRVEPPDLLRRPGQDAGRHAHRKLRPDDCRPYGPVRDALPEQGRLDDHGR